MAFSPQKLVHKHISTLGMPTKDNGRLFLHNTKFNSS
jgi:hypothetical protein